MVSKAVIDTLIAEAGGEGEEGLIAAAWAIQQRAAANGVSIDKVVRSGFDGFTNPGSGAVKAQGDAALRRKVEQIMTGVESGAIPNPVPGADHFLSGDVMPGWAKSMKLVATVGGHRFYASGKVPDAAQGNSVATALDTQRPSPTPATPSAAVTAARNKQNMTPAADLQAMDRHKGAAFLSKDGQKVIDTAGVVFGDQMTTRLPGSGPSASDKVRAAAVVPRPAAVVAPAVSASDMARGNTPPVAAPKPATSASDKVRGTNGWETIATIPTTAVGGPPTTRKVQSIPITAPTQPTKPTQPSNMASARSEQAAARGPGTPKVIAPKLDGIGDMPAFDDLGLLRSPLQVPGAPVPAAPTAAIIAARQPKKVAPVPAVRQAIVPPVAPRQPASVAVATARSVVPAPAATTVAAFQAQGMTAAQAYDAANKAAKDRAEAGATKGHTSSGGMKYDPDSGGWKWTG